MKRVASYGRYSSTLQSQSSIQDQLSLIAHHVEKQPGWQIVNQYQDAASSGSTFISRPGIRQLMADAERGKFDIIIAESLDRFTRDQADAAILYKKMRFFGIQIITVSEGEITELHIGLKGTMNALYLKDLSEKTKRGLRGRIEAGLSAGGCGYGYRVLKKLNPDGTPMRGQRKINEVEAVVIRRIFTEFAAGRSPRAIARDLNATKIKGPNGKKWNDTTIRGHHKRGTGIINNELYIGRLIWNRLRYQKDLETGRRVSRLNPPEELVINNLPKLRIVDDALWEAVRKRQKIISEMSANMTASIQSYHSNNRLSGMRRPVSLLSGKVFCAECGGHYSLRGAKRFVCSNHIGQGTCANGRTILRVTLENMAVSGWKRLLAKAELISVAQRTFAVESRRLQGDALIGTAHIKSQLAQTDKEIAALVNAIKAGMFHESMKAELDRLERLKLELREQVNACNDIKPVPAELEQLFKGKLSELTQCLNQREHIHVAGDIIRSLIDKIVIQPQPLRGHMEIQIFGPICETLSLNDQEQDEGRSETL
ncbi:recombinase family protein [Ochrobactrum chromiisoli]|uniref:Recombinase family protein n=1 Tax=Ochrobactrum chromiisoli TaxID=2993941 RepID=A0ABT3QP86_9HYPH|nr:recombinase family protein [Ochrobactrum chromiisoli]MCX2697428.1 recombinase family protein [Ochrobactrum chromiisoli]